MADEQLLSENNVNCTVISSTESNLSNNNNNNIVDAKLINRSNGDVSGAANSANLKTNGNIKIKCEFTNDSPPPASTELLSTEPPDGGARAWCVMISAFFCNSIIFGIINTFGIMYIKIFDYLKESGDSEAASKAALVGSLTIGTTFFLSPVSGVLTDKIGLRLTTFIGGVLTTGGMLLSSVVYTNINLLYLTYGVMFGLGAALAYTPTLAILGHYFKKKLGVVSGFVTCGSSLATIALPPFLTFLLDKYGFSGTCLVLGGLSSVVILCSLVYKPIQPPPPPPKRKPGQSALNMHVKSLVNLDNWKRTRYVVWSLSIPVALIGYFVPYVHGVAYVKEVYPTEDGNLPIMCIGLTSGLGRLAFGYIADHRGVNRILLQQLSFVAMGLLTIAIPLIESFPVLIGISLCMGIFDGCFISLLGPVAYDLCGAQGATQAIGFLLGLCSVPLTAGAPIAGFIYDQTRSYRLSYILAGIPALVGAALMTLTHYLRDDRIDHVSDKQNEDQVHKLLNKPAWTEDVAGEMKEKMNGNGYTFHKISNGGGHIAKSAPLAADTTEFQIDENIESKL